MLRNTHGIAPLALIGVVLVSALLGGVGGIASGLGGSSTTIEVSGKNAQIYGPPAPSSSQPVDTGSSTGSFWGGLSSTANSAVGMTTMVAAIMPLVIVGFMAKMMRGGF